MRKMYKCSRRTDSFINKASRPITVDFYSQNFKLFGLSQNLGFQYFCLVHERVLHSSTKCISSAI